MTIRIETKSGAFDIEADPFESVLFAGLRQGLTLPYECATGTCGTCRARVMQGQVITSWDQAPGHSKLKRDKGDILMCQSRADGPCVLRVPSTVAASSEVGPATLAGQIIAIQQFTHDVRQFEVKLDQLMTFDAGQFVVVSAPGITGGRAYSMVNHARATDRLTFVVKRKPGGGFSDWLFDGTQVGSPIELFGPLGRATFRPHERHDLIVVAGGSGIAGMMSILACATAAGHFRDHKGHVYFGVRTLADGFYLEELANYVAAANGGLHVTLVLSHEAPVTTTHPSYHGLQLDHGFVHEAAARGLHGYDCDGLAFIAGPPPMVDAAIAMLLRDVGIAAQAIRYDKFG